MKVLKIDPHLRRITEHEVDDDYPFISETIGGCFCQGFLVRHRNRNNIGYVHDEGLHQPWGWNSFFLVPWQPQPLRGPCVVTGVLPDGDSTSVSLAAEELETQVQWLSEVEMAMAVHAVEEV
jgi:hypothetical protein